MKVPGATSDVSDGTDTHAFVWTCARLARITNGHACSVKLLVFYNTQPIMRANTMHNDGPFARALRKCTYKSNDSGAIPASEEASKKPRCYCLSGCFRLDGGRKKKEERKKLSFSCVLSQVRTTPNDLVWMPPLILLLYSTNTSITIAAAVVKCVVVLRRRQISARGA